MALDLIAELGRPCYNEEDCRTREIDMSPKAIAARLEEVRALYKLMVSLGTIDTTKATRVEP